MNLKPVSLASPLSLDELRVLKSKRDPYAWVAPLLEDCTLALLPRKPHEALFQTPAAAKIVVSAHAVRQLSQERFPNYAVRASGPEVQQDLQQFCATGRILREGPSRHGGIKDLVFVNPRPVWDQMEVVATLFPDHLHIPTMGFSCYGKTGRDGDRQPFAETRVGVNALLLMDWLSAGEEGAGRAPEAEDLLAVEYSGGQRRWGHMYLPKNGAPVFATLSHHELLDFLALRNVLELAGLRAHVNTMMKRYGIARTLLRVDNPEEAIRLSRGAGAVVVGTDPEGLGRLLLDSLMLRARKEEGHAVSDPVVCPRGHAAGTDSDAL